MDEQLTPNFKLSEFVHGEGHVAPAILANLKRLAEALQKIRDELKKPITITSGYRTPEHNATVPNAAKGSYHTRGMAADIQIKGMTPKQVQEHLKAWPHGLGSYTTHTHVDIRPYKARWKGK